MICLGKLIFIDFRDRERNIRKELYERIHVLKPNEEYWLGPGEQQQLVKLLYDVGIIKYDPEGKLPLKKGGTTDLYINLRDLRSEPLYLEMVAEHYISVLEDLEVTHFAEVPDAVSCIAGVVSVGASLPYVTIRDKPKEGRVSNKNFIGRFHASEPLVIIDDVITDGASKIEPIRECLNADVKLGPLIVLVDRDDGWKEKFAQENIEQAVWAAMSLSRVREIVKSL